MQAFNDKKVKISSPGQLLVLGMGGTIAGLAANPQAPEHYLAAQRSVAHLLSELQRDAMAGGADGGLQAAGVSVMSQQVAQIDSQDLTPAHWQKLLQALWPALGDPDVVGVVITHGTDTLEETATFLDEVLSRTWGPLGKPIVLTCAMRPGNAPDADGPQNLADALALARDQSAQAQGLWVVCAGQAHAAKGVRKTHPQRLDAFDSGDTLAAAQCVGPAGTGRQWVWSSPPRAAIKPAPDRLQKPDLLLKTAPEAWPKVAILTHHAGSEAWEVAAWVNAGVQGIVVASTGNGTVSAAWREALLKAQAQGVALRFTTRCAQGRPTQVPEGMAAEVLENARLDVTPAKARVRLQIGLLMDGGGV